MPVSVYYFLLTSSPDSIVCWIRCFSCLWAVLLPLFLFLSFFLNFFPCNKINVSRVFCLFVFFPPFHSDLGVLVGGAGLQISWLTFINTSFILMLFSRCSGIADNLTFLDLLRLGHAPFSTLEVAYIWPCFVLWKLPVCRLVEHMTFWEHRAFRYS